MRSEEEEEKEEVVVAGDGWKESDLLSGVKKKKKEKKRCIAHTQLLHFPHPAEFFFLARDLKNSANFFFEKKSLS